MSTPDLTILTRGIPINPLPPLRPLDVSRPHAPVHTNHLSADEERTALANALRYFPTALHATLAPEFATELHTYGHIYMYRFRPHELDLPMRAYPISDYPAKSMEAAAMMLMIMNNLDPVIAQFPDELVTYGGNGQVFSNWAQFWLVMYYLSRLTQSQTLVLASGHPQGLFPSSPSGPRAVITNGMVVPAAYSPETYERLFGLGVSMYGQMTAGSFCYIGPQGIVHGTTITIINAIRKRFPSSSTTSKVFISSGLGGMSGAQAKAAVIAGCIAVIAEVSEEALKKRHCQGWLVHVADDLEHVISMVRKFRKDGTATSIGYHGNVVTLWERLVKEYEATGELLSDIGSDQTSCHNPFLGGYYPVGITYEASRMIMKSDPEMFKKAVESSLCRQVAAINYLSEKGMFFFDYGNAFLLQSARAGADVLLPGANKPAEPGAKSNFRYQSYVQDIMGDVFSLGFGPFRWVCATGNPRDLAMTDKIALEVLQEKASAPNLPPAVKQQYMDNIQWIEGAGQHNLVVGSQARILYSDQAGRVALAEAFNDAIDQAKINGCVILSRDHHDVSGTDSPYRETSNIYDGSAFCADMAVHNVIGDSFRGASWVALHNGGGVGWGEVINGGFGLLLDGSSEAVSRARLMLSWDVSNGVARRAWSGNQYAIETIRRTMEASDNQLEVTLPNHVQDESLLDKALQEGVALE